MKTWNAAGTWDILKDPDFPYDNYVHKTITPWPVAGEWKWEHWGTGIVNRVGLANPGLYEYLGLCPKIMRALGPKTQVWTTSIYGGMGLSFWESLAGRINTNIELNLSCPNYSEDAREKDPKWFDEIQYMKSVAEACSGVMMPWQKLGAKLGPHHTVEHAKAVVEGGDVDYLTLTNSLQTPRGGLSGPPIRSLSLDLIGQVRHALPDIHIIGCGGIMSSVQASGFRLAGADDVAIGTGHLVNNMQSPLCTP